MAKRTVTKVRAIPATRPTVDLVVSNVIPVNDKNVALIINN